MGWLSTTINSSLGKKYITAISGMFLLLYLVIHLFGNSFLYLGPEAFNQYVYVLTESGLHYIIQVIEVILFLGFIVHGYEGIRLTLQNWKARPNRYAVRPKDPQSTIASRTMWFTAAIIFIFLVIHLQNFWYLYKTGIISEKFTMYQAVVETFQNPVYSAIYLVAMYLMGYHLWHGFQSSFQSLGLNHTKYMPFIVAFGRVYAVVISVGFASFPIYFYFFYGRQ